VTRRPIHRTGCGAILVVTLGLLAGLVAPAVTQGAGAGTVAHNPNGRLLGVLPSQTGAASPAAIAQPNVVNPVTYHSGPVQHASAVYAIFWAPSVAPFPTNYGATVVRYFSDVAHDSFKPSNPYGSDTQYYDLTGTVKRFVSYAVTYKNVFTDTHAYPANGCPNYKLDDGTTSKKCLTDAQMLTEINSVINAHALPKGMGTQYFLFTPKGVASCFTANGLSAGNCYDPFSFPGFCAYHSFVGSGSTAVLYANMPFAGITGCSSGQSPQGNVADSVLNGISHEHQETMTDPLGTAWYDVDGNEVADKCAFTFGAPLGTNSFGQFNEIINTHDYWLQEIWSNRDMACVQRNTWPQPTAAFSFSPTAPAAGTAVHFTSASHSGDGTALKYHWTFPGGTVSTAVNPTFTFTTAGAKVVTLVVADTSGDQARLSKTVTVH
jgi:PKD repeat protein